MKIWHFFKSSSVASLPFSVSSASHVVAYSRLGAPKVFPSSHSIHKSIRRTLQYFFIDKIIVEVFRFLSSAYFKINKITQYFLATLDIPSNLSKFSLNLHSYIHSTEHNPIMIYMVLSTFIRVPQDTNLGPQVKWWHPQDFHWEVVTPSSRVSYIIIIFGWCVIYVPLRVSLQYTKMQRITRTWFLLLSSD